MNCWLVKTVVEEVVGDAVDYVDNVAADDLSASD